ncbi:YgaP family membrane protein [Eudoraea chungangensis]|uniref:YgaP family membrane protein n=1 Tax=Eudoraea chungangensis TaxID=1481905 RepID=UPI0023ECADAF|nr:DUF2892 domain-containing protein [Eudoraea chungangensis]
MKRNMGKTDKIVRVALAIIAALLVYFDVVQGTFAYVLLAMASVFILTSLISFCPVYGLVGLNTCKVKKT